MENEASDKWTTIFVALLGIGMVAWGITRARQPMEVSDAVKQEIKNSKDKGGGMVPIA